MAARAATVDGYLRSVDAKKRRALERLRQAIRAAAPNAEECISYQLPAFRLGGRFLVAFGAASKHCAFYPGALPIAVHRAALKSYDSSKGTLRFPPDAPLPDRLVRKLVKTRVAEIASDVTRKRS